MQDAWDSFKDGLSMSTLDEIAWIKGKLTSKRLTDALASGDPQRVEWALQMQTMLTTRMNTLEDLMNGVDLGPPVPGLDPWRNWASRVRSIVTSVGNVRVDHVTGPGYSGHRAAGGPVQAGGTYLVGERGPEMLTMGGSGGHITPNHQLGGQPIVIELDGDVIYRNFDRRMGKRLAMSSSNAYTRG
jgi:hypothetical protein